jgi:hypothetical protein
VVSSSPWGDGRLGVDSKEYRAKARELRETARTTNDPTAHGDLLVMAARYDWLAVRAEDQERGAKKP